MEDDILNQFVSELSRDLVSEVAPQELPLFRAASEAFYKDPENLTAERPATDDMLGFGTGEAVALLTPVIIAVSQQVVLFVMEQVKKSGEEQGATLINETVKKMFKKFRPARKDGPVPLDSEQLAQVRKMALKQALELKLSEQRARLLADAIVGRLAIG